MYFRKSSFEKLIILSRITYISREVLLTLVLLGSLRSAKRTPGKIYFTKELLQNLI